ncbi:MAG: FxDxF family PEP-CTERM protein, partial [Burkholderiales bacterium]|nr:FxDxF family PEP-CTERM protein [Burkholderiales bacterium]
FWIADSPYYDNSGGVSLSVAAVPEPETWALMLAGLGLLGFAARRRI